MKGGGTRRRGHRHRVTKKRKRGSSKRRHHKTAGRHMRHRSRGRMRGGLSLANILVDLPFGQEVVNIGRVFTTGAKNMVRGYRGVKPAVSPMPTKGQFKSDLKYKRITPPNVSKIRKAAKSDVASLEGSLK